MHLGESHFAGQHGHENIKLLLRKHILVLLFSLLPSIFLIILAIVAYVAAPFLFPDVLQSPYYEYFLLVLNLFVLYSVGLAFLTWMDWYLDVWILTEERIVDIKQAGLFARDVSELELNRVQDVTVQARGVFSTVFNYGNVQIQTAGEKLEFLFEQVPNPYATKDAIIKAAHNYKPLHTHP